MCEACEFNRDELYIKLLNLRFLSNRYAVTLVSIPLNALFFSLAGSDYVGTSGQLVFVPNGPKEQCIQIDIIVDDVAEPPEMLNVMFSFVDLPPGVRQPPPVAPANVTILDNMAGMVGLLT